MPSTGSVDVKVTNWDTLRFTWTADTKSVAENTSAVSWKMLLISGSDGAISSTAEKNWSVTLDGSKYSGKNTVGIGNNATKTLASGSKTLVHAADGSKTFAFSFSQQFDITFAGTSIGTKSGSGNGSAPVIYQASQPSLITWPETTNNVGNFGDKISIHMNRKHSAFTHTVRYAFGNRTGTIATNVATGVEWTIPLDFMDLLPAATHGSGLIYVDTYNGGSLVGTRYTGFTAFVPAHIKPYAYIQAVDSTGLKDKYGALVKGKSRLQVKVTADIAYSSPIASYAATADGVRYSIAEFTTDYVKSTPVEVTATVTDKRGRTSVERSETLSVLSYTPPAVTTVTVRRCTQNGTEDPQGEYVQVTFSARITSLYDKNGAAYRIKYKKSTETNYTTVTHTASAGKYTVSNATYIFAADSSSSYDVVVEATDDFGTGSRSAAASTAFTLMNWGTNGTSFAVGKVAEKANAFELGVRAYDQYGTHISNGMSLYGGASTPIDANTTTEHLILTSLNTPTTSLWYVETIFYSSKLVSSDRRRVAMPYRRGGLTYSRYYTAGAWSEWESEALAVWPVGSIYIAYTHTYPGNLFGGKWERIQDAFLWATPASGTIGVTGGASEVTLTAAQMPKHNHGGTYTNAGDARTHAWLASGGAAMGYDTVDAGAGEPHSNMPPYIQVAVWRRTA